MKRKKNRERQSCCTLDIYDYIYTIYYIHPFSFNVNILIKTVGYIIYVIIGVSATFVIIVIITLIMNKRKKVIKKREVLEDLINHSKYLKESYNLHKVC